VKISHGNHLVLQLQKTTLTKTEFHGLILSGDSITHTSHVCVSATLLITECKGKVVSALNQTPRHEDVSCAARR